MVEAADTYRVVIPLPEIAPGFTDKQILVAFLRNGKPLDEKEGPYRERYGFAGHLGCNFAAARPRGRPWSAQSVFRFPIVPLVADTMRTRHATTRRSTQRTRRNAISCSTPRHSFVRINHRQCWWRQKNSPEREHEAQHQRRQNRNPHGNLRGSPHQIRLQQKSIEHHNNRIQSQYVRRMLPVSPADCSGNDRPHHPQRRTKVGHKLQNCRQQRPKGCPWHSQRIQANQPQHADRQRVLALRYEPALQRAACYPEMIAEVHPLSHHSVRRFPHVRLKMGSPTEATA